MQRVAQKSFGRGLRRGAFEAPARRSLLEYVLVADDAAGRVDGTSNSSFCRGRKNRVCQYQMWTSLAIIWLASWRPTSRSRGFRGIVHIENDGRIVAAELRALSLRELFCVGQGFRARHFESTEASGKAR